MLCREAFEGGGNGFAGSAPGGVEIYDEKRRLLQFVKLGK